jgi:type IV secretion system protein VirB10
MIGVLLSRGPDAVLDKGTTLEMVLDRPVNFTDTELNFGNYQTPPVVVAPSSSGSSGGGSIPGSRSRFPF